MKIFRTLSFGLMELLTFLLFLLESKQLKMESEPEENYSDPEDSRNGNDCDSDLYHQAQNRQFRNRNSSGLSRSPPQPQSQRIKKDAYPSPKQKLASSYPH